MRPRRPPAPALRALLGGAAAVALAACSGDEGPRLVVTSSFTDEAILLDPADGRVTGRIPLDPRRAERDGPHGVEVAADGSFWVVTVSHGDASLWVFESEGDRLVGRVDLGLPSAGRAGLSPDGTRAVVPDYWLGGTGQVSEVVALRMDDLQVTHRLTPCPAPHQASFSPDGRWLAVVCPLSDEVLLLDGTTYEERHRVRLPERPGAPWEGQPGNPRTRPMNLAWAPGSDRFWVTLMRQGAVAMVDTAGRELARGATPRGPVQIAVTPDGSKLVVPAREDFVVAILDAATLEPLGRAVLADGPHPHGVALSPDGATAYVTNEGTTRSVGGVAAIRLFDGAVLWRTEVGVFNLGVAWRPATSGTR